MNDHNVYNPDFNRNVIQVYTEETGFTGFKGLEWNKLDNIEELLRNTSSPASVDAFGRQRVADLFTLADYSHIYGEETELLTKTVDSGFITFVPEQAKAILSVGTGINDSVIHQSRMYHHYMPGKSQLTFQSFNFLGVSSGTNKRIGLFDDFNGIYFQLSGDGTLSFGLRSNVSGQVTNEMVNQTNWNIDKCNGSGPSAFNIDLTKTQLFYSDYQWLGVGRVRVGFVHDGNTIIAHEFYNSNYKDAVYWRSPSLPVRSQIAKYATGFSGSMDQICATVLSEGGYNEAGVDFSARNTGPIDVPRTGKIPVLAIALKTGYINYPNRSIVRPLNVNCVTLTGPIVYEFWRLPSTGSIIGGNWISVNNESVCLYNPTATSVNYSSGIMINDGFVAAGGVGVGNRGPAQTAIANISSAKRGYISQNIDSTDSNIFLIVASGIDSVTNNIYPSATFASIQWRETR